MYSRLPFIDHIEVGMDDNFAFNKLFVVVWPAKSAMIPDSQLV
ncbi:MAG: hypothetical protein Q4C95_05495 [Planctomycetia bacterium]|nr:hypothetical protein [Planctomycetia bacterium]